VFKDYDYESQKAFRKPNSNEPIAFKDFFKKGQELVNLNYDCVIYGSDQIWWRHSPFPTYPGFDPVFWGEYIPSSSKKIAYAASMGQIDIDSHDKDFIKNALVHFNHISVREEGLRQLLQPLTSKNILTAVDPTLLMGIDFWKKYADAFIPKEKYVLLYNLNPSKAAEQLARKKAQQLNCRYIEITGAVNPLKIGKEYKQTVDAFEFITYIRHAEYVVTTSFHGTAFSIKGLCEAIEKEVGYPLKRILTGGYAKFVAPLFEEFEYAPSLCLEGLAAIYDKN
jgi:hypothetical protein